MDVTTTTVGQETARLFAGTPDYDPDRLLDADELRCPDCGFISRDGTEAERAHDELCGYVIPA